MNRSINVRVGLLQPWSTRCLGWNGYGTRYSQARLCSDIIFTPSPDGSCYIFRLALHAASPVVDAADSDATRDRGSACFLNRAACLVGRLGDYLVSTQRRHTPLFFSASLGHYPPTSLALVVHLHGTSWNKAFVVSVQLMQVDSRSYLYYIPYNTITK